MTTPEKIRHITDFVNNADEKVLDRIMDLIENSQSNIVGYTDTGEPITREEALDALNGERNVISNEELEKRREALSRLNSQDNSAKQPGLKI